MEDGCGSYGKVELNEQELLPEILLVQSIHDRELARLLQKRIEISLVEFALKKSLLILYHRECCESTIR